MIIKDLWVTASGMALGDTDTAADVENKSAVADRLAQQLTSVSISDVPAPVLGARAAGLAWARHPDRRRDERVGHVFACHTATGPPSWSPASWIAGEVIGRERVVLAEQLTVACAGGVAALGAAARWLRCERKLDSVLVTAADAFDPAVLDRWSFDSGLTLGDGAGAVVLSRAGAGHRLLSVTTGADVSLEVCQRGSWPIGFEQARPHRPARGRERLREAIVDSAGALDIPTIVRRHGALLTRVVDEALAEAGLERGDVTHWALPFVGAEALDHGYLRPLGIGIERTSRSPGLTTGHLGGADAFVALDRLESRAVMRGGDVVALVGVGSGLSVSCAVLRW